MEPIPTIDLTESSEPEYFTLLDDERRQAEKDLDKAMQEFNACLNEREQMIQFLEEVMDEDKYLCKVREQVEFKLRRAEAALKIIDDKSWEVYFGLDSSSSEEGEERSDQINNS